MAKGFGCRIVLDSVSEAGQRLTTVEAKYPRMVHCELMTHRMFSRNAASSRAIPIEKIIRMVEEDPAMPVWWGKNQSGMQAEVELDMEDRPAAIHGWLHARDVAVQEAHKLVSLGLHKQIVNRILEPWAWITVCITATDWANFFKLRCHPEAQPEIRHIAEMIQKAMQESVPMARRWHLPYLHPDETPDVWADVPTWNGFDMRSVCVARAARISYLTQDGIRDLSKDVEMYERLRKNGHYSPFEHVAEAMETLYLGGYSGNFCGWTQYRKSLLNESGREFEWSQFEWQQPNAMEAKL